MRPSLLSFPLQDAGSAPMSSTETAAPVVPLRLGILVSSCSAASRALVATPMMFWFMRLLFPDR